MVADYSRMDRGGKSTEKKTLIMVSVSYYFQHITKNSSKLCVNFKDYSANQ